MSGPAAASHGPRAAIRARARVAATGAAVALADLAPPGIRYGYVQPLAGRLLRRTLPAVPATPGVRFAPAAAERAARPADLRCGLVADRLDVGGVGRVVEMLAEGLGSSGIAPVVVCPDDGARARRLRALGVEVVVAPDAVAAERGLAAARLDAVQLHSAPRHLVAAALGLGVPAVPVLHNTEIHYSPAMWAQTADLFRRSAAVVAVSEVVRRFHVQRLPADASGGIVVVANGSMPVRLTPEARSRARDTLAATLGVPLAGEVVVVCLARYDSQKNIAGVVSAFLRAPVRERRMRLVVAGDPSDWLEHARADAIARAHPDGDRVHLLGDSDAATALVASDVFVLDSFFEGWPLAATEAVAVGLPVVLSDTGGAAELVARAAPGSALVANPTGPADLVSDRRARAARRRARRQPNAGALGDALVAAAAGGGARPAAPPSDDGFGAMIRGHADVLRAVTARPAPPARAGGVPAATEA